MRYIQIDHDNISLVIHSNVHLPYVYEYFVHNLHYMNNEYNQIYQYYEYLTYVFVNQ